MLGSAGRVPASSTLSAEQLVTAFNRTQQALKVKRQQAKTFCTRHPALAFDIDEESIASLLDGQKETLLTLADTARTRTPSPVANPGHVLPKDFLQALPAVQAPEAASEYAVTWIDATSRKSQGFPIRIIYDPKHQQLWECAGQTRTVHGRKIEAIPGQAGSSPSEYIPSGIFYQIQPVNGKTLTRDKQACVSTKNDLIIVECDSKDRERLVAWERVAGLIPLPCFAEVETGGRGAHISFVMAAKEKAQLKKTLGPLLLFLGNDPTGWNDCKLTRLPNCGRGEKNKLQSLKWFSPKPSPLNPECQAKDLADFASRLYAAVEQNRAAVEASIQAMLLATAHLNSQLRNAKLKQPSPQPPAPAKPRRQSGSTKPNKSPELEARRQVGVEVMNEFRRKLAHQLKQVPKDGKYDIDKVPKGLIQEVARHYHLADAHKINLREIKRCLQRVCDTPHRVIGTGRKTDFGRLSDAEFESPLNVPYLFDRWAPQSKWWEKNKTKMLFAEFAWAVRILNTATAKKSKPLVNLQSGDRQPAAKDATRTTLGSEAGAGEVITFLKNFARSQPPQAIVAALGSNPFERIAAAATVAFKPSDRVDLFIKAMQRVGATDSDLDSLLSEIDIKLKAVNWSTWDWIEEDIYRLEEKYWDWDKVAKCGAAAKAIIREAVASIVNQRLTKKHRSPFVAPPDIYHVLTKTNLEKLESNIIKGSESTKDKAARLKEGVLTKIRRGLRELNDMVAEVAHQNGVTTKFRLLGLGLNNSNRRLKEKNDGSRPTNKAYLYLKEETKVLKKQPIEKVGTTELGLKLGSKNKPPSTIPSKPGMAFYNLKIHQTNGDVLLGRDARGQNATKNISGFKYKAVKTIYQAKEIQVFVKKVLPAKYNKVQIFGLVVVSAAVSAKLPETDIIQGKDGNRYVQVKFYLKPPKEFKKSGGELVLATDADVSALQIFGQKLEPRKSTQAGKRPYWVLLATVQSAESIEVAAIFGKQNNFETERRWRWEELKDKM